MTNLFWFRHDLRLRDNTGLYRACRDGAVAPCLILDDAFLKNPTIGPNRCALFLRAAAALDSDLKRRGGKLIVRRGKPEIEIPKLLRECKADGVYLNRDYEPYAIARDKSVERAVTELGATYHSFKDLVVFERGEVLTQAGKPYTIYSQYRKSWLAQEDSPPSLPLPRFRFPDGIEKIASIDLPLNEFIPESSVPEITERSAHKSLNKFTDDTLLRYAETRDFPAISGTSQLSPHLKFGTINPRSILKVAREIRSASRRESSRNSIDTFISELIWRDFFFQIFAEFPHCATESFRLQYRNVRWENNPEWLEAWKHGRTGFPIVDAGMRQLQQTGWMHNRVRMITASFLCKDLLIDWREGEKHFSRLLIDGERAVNNGNWQWAAGTGTDAQPFFRIFNPSAQSERFDPDCVYIKRWVPELKGAASDEIHNLTSKVPDYPVPIVDHAVQRAKALALYKKT